MKILHISESFEGGVASAVANYVDLTSEHTHVLLCSKREGRVGSGILGKFSTIYDLTKGHFSAIKTVREIVDKERPDVIHCHSSFGGGYGRLAYFFKRCPALMVYSPHCYAFERLDMPFVVRWVYRCMEWVLARRTDAVVACSLRERGLATGLRRKTKVIFVPNLPSVKAGTSLPFKKRKNTVVMSGRLTAQKDPRWFAKVAEKLGSEVKCVWLGSGEDKYVRMLRRAGVQVTGWVTPERVAKTLSGAKVYLHTARWEGFPITILDATRCGVAVVAREAGYLEGVGGANVVADVDMAVGVVGGLLKDGDRWENNRRIWRDALKENNPKVAKKRLLGAYGVKKN